MLTLSINERRNYCVQRIEKKPWVTCANYWQRILYMKGPTTQQRLDRKNFFPLFVYSFLPSAFLVLFFLLFLASFRIFPPTFFHPHFPIRIRHPQVSGPRLTDTPVKSLKLLSTLGKVSCHGNSLGFCHSVERLIKSRTNFHNVMKQTTTGQAFKKRWNFFKIYFNEKINLNLAKYIHTYFIVVIVILY